MLVVSGDDGKPMAQSRRGDVAVLDGHPLAGLVELTLQVRPDVRHRDVEAADAPLHGIDQSGKPILEGLPLSSLFCPDPVGELRYYYRAGIAVFPFFAEPGNNTAVWLTLSRLA